MVFGSYTIMFFIFLCVILITCPKISIAGNFTVKVVDQSGNGDYQRIQDAIDSVPSGNTENVLILVKQGVYREKVVVPLDKPSIILTGVKPEKTVITWNDHGNIFTSPTVSVLASDFICRYITIQNTHGPGDKAVALRVSGDRVAFFGCRILGHQDTLLDDTGRHYYCNAYIEGDTDFIFGDAASAYKKCHLHSVTESHGSITAQHRISDEQSTGFLFMGCRITGTKTNGTWLGRPWADYSRVVFIETYMSDVVLSQGWDDWNEPSRQRTVYYGEYRNYGAGARRSGRVKWSRNLTPKEAAPFLTLDIIGGRTWIRSARKLYKEIYPIIAHYRFLLEIPEK